jgi:hypothetical protein
LWCGFELVLGWIKMCRELVFKAPDVNVSLKVCVNVPEVDLCWRMTVGFLF